MKTKSVSQPTSPMPSCGCAYKWKAIGRLYGVSMGYGWIRMDASPDCTEAHR